MRLSTVITQNVSLEVGGSSPSRLMGMVKLDVQHGWTSQ